MEEESSRDTCAAVKMRFTRHTSEINMKEGLPFFGFVVVGLKFWDWSVCVDVKEGGQGQGQQP